MMRANCTLEPRSMPCWTRRYIAWAALLGGLATSLLFPSQAHAQFAEGSGRTLSHKGIYVLYWGLPYRDNFKAHVDDVLSLPYVSGLAIYLPWRVMEPEPDRFDWSILDTALSEAQRYQKGLSFGVQVASQSPEWVKGRSASFQYQHPNARVGVQTAPVPWDPQYQADFTSMVTELGRRYNGQPNISFVTISGPSTLFGVETNWPMNRGWGGGASDFSLSRFEQGWQQSIELYRRVFTRTNLAIGLDDNIGDPATPKSVFRQAVTKIRDYALSQITPQSRLTIRLLGLTANSATHFNGGCTTLYSTNVSLNQYIALAWDARQYANLSYQMGGIASRATAQRSPLTPEEFLAALQNGASCGAQTIEVKYPDVWDLDSDAPYRPYASSIQQVQTELLSARF